MHPTLPELPRIIATSFLLVLPFSSCRRLPPFNCLLESISVLGSSHNTRREFSRLRGPPSKSALADTEVQYLWPCPKSSGAFLFFAVRYGALLGNIPLTVFSFVSLSPAVSFHRISVESGCLIRYAWVRGPCAYMSVLPS